MSPKRLSMAHAIIRQQKKDINARLKLANHSAPGLGSRIAARFAKAGLTVDLPELRDQPARSALANTFFCGGIEK